MEHVGTIGGIRFPISFRHDGAGSVYHQAVQLQAFDGIEKRVNRD